VTGRKLVSAVSGAILVAVIEFGSASLLQAAVQQDSVTVQLRSRHAVLSPETTDSFFRALRAAADEALHGLVFLRSIPKDSVRGVLRERGFEFQTRIQGRVYVGRFARTLEPNDDLVRAYVGAAAAIEPRDKVHPDIWNGRYERFVLKGPDGDSNYVRRSDGRLNLLVAFHQATPSRHIAEVLRRFTQQSAKIGETDWSVVLRSADVRRLAAEDVVLAIDAGPPPLLLEQLAIPIETLPLWKTTVATELRGSGVQIGVFDSGIDDENDDFRSSILGVLGPSRVILTDPARKNHGTLVAGTIAGSGWWSSRFDSWGYPNRGTPYQWRGVAPASQLIEAAIFNPGPIDYNTGKVLGYIQSQGMDLSNHSYGLGKHGSGRDYTALHDRVIRGDEPVDGVFIPPRLEVRSAGNELEDDGYFSLTNEQKNGLVVGNWSPDPNRIQPQSSIGPTTDGRIKPDVVAPGTQVVTTGFYQLGDLPFCKLRDDAGEFHELTYPDGKKADGTTAPDTRQQFYCVTTGTSISAPVVTGMLALVLQQYAATYAVDLDDAPPLPSTLRGLAIHSALDRAAPDPWFTSPDPKIQAFPGPDFASGWGLVDPDGVVELVRNRLILVGQIKTTCEVARYSFPVTGGTPGDPVKVTLAWDDPAEDPLSADALPRLKNDLDLVLIDPAGVRHYPWQLDQQITDPAGNLLKPEEQTCGSDIRVKRAFDPLPIKVPASAVVPAAIGPDHLNNVEQVVAPGMTGTWYAEVSGFDLMSPQSFSLIGVPVRLFLPDWTNFCERHHCESWLPDLCRLYPVICRPLRDFPILPRGLGVAFRDRADRIILPVRDLCAHLGAPDACYRAGVSYDVEIGPSSSGVGVEVYTGEGRHAAGRITARSAYRLHLDQGNVESLLVLSPSRNTRVDYRYPLRLAVRPR
jgi:subtilisin family serine protease